ncbi:MAG TPA: protein-methionine-sulfoxide reductase heme-binding subunit MsrQ [Planctomycetota bacterium]|nr:protein-methionine-sulfoxide reductase heme-binding subunit MsrQ [Planctomycetota bacterium]
MANLSSTSPASRKIYNALIYWAVFLAASAPLAWHGYKWYAGKAKVSLEAELIVRYFGYFALILLLASLTCTPLRILFKWSWPARVRKTLGLFGFFYACVHLFIYVFYQQDFEFKNLFVRDEDLDRNLYATIFGDAWKFPFQLFGMAAFLLLIPLALTSTNWAVRKLGGKNWQRLHYLVYPIAILGVVHFYMGIKSKTEKTPAWILAGVLAVLLGVRVVKRLLPKRKAMSALKPFPLTPRAGTPVGPLPEGEGNSNQADAASQGETL